MFESRLWLIRTKIYSAFTPRHGSLECDRRTDGQKCCNKDGDLHLGLALTSYLGIPGP